MNQGLVHVYTREVQAAWEARRLGLNREPWRHANGIAVGVNVYETAIQNGIARVATGLALYLRRWGEIKTLLRSS